MLLGLVSLFFKNCLFLPRNISYYQGLAGSYNQLMESKDPQQRQLGIFFCQVEYENFYNVLQTCLENRDNIEVFFCLFRYLILINDTQSLLKLSEFVYHKIETYPSEICIGEIGLQVAMLLDHLAYCYSEVKNYQDSKKIYQELLKIYQNLTGLSETDIKSALAVTHHQLGNISQDLK